MIGPIGFLILLIIAWVVVVVAGACGAFDPIRRWALTSDQRAMIYHCNHALATGLTHELITDEEYDLASATANWRVMLPLLNDDPWIRL